MDCNRIDISPMRPNWGCVWQGGSVDEAIDQLPKPLAILCMNRGEVDDGFIDHSKGVHLLLAALVDDADESDPQALLPDPVLLGLADAAVSLLRRGVHIYVHCAAGVSRSTYIDCAIHMRALSVGYLVALSLVRQARPRANPNPSFAAHLLRLEPELLKS